MALTMFTYPVHRQRLPEMPWRIWSSVGAGCFLRNAELVISMPGVQYPHCNPCSSMKPSWSGWSLPFCSKPSTVMSCLLWAWTAYTVQDLTVRRGLDGHGADIREADACLLARALRVQVGLARHRRRREVTHLPLELEVRPSAARGRARHPDLRQDLVGSEGRGEGAGEEGGHRDAALALRARGHDLRTEREHGGGVIVGRVAVGQVAAHGGQVAHEGISDD